MLDSFFFQLCMFSKDCLPKVRSFIVKYMCVCSMLKHSKDRNGEGGGRGLKKQGKQTQYVGDEDTKHQDQIYLKKKKKLLVKRDRSKKFPQSENKTVFFYLIGKKEIIGTLQKN